MFAKMIESDGRFLFQDFDNGGVEITAEEHAALIDGQSKGKRIVADSDGRPVLALQIPPTPKQITLGEISAIESTITDRRIREAILGIDGGWLANVNDQIAALRKTL
jgi:hypothetical protein